ncbi:hypothetical protein AB4Y45_33485 [Paraburkholderia sp. EG287A]|uniref:hypothetical protein n=1 Tax=Paraburkholderia sp. EG287A TaxID=3237012 RepID=UPI0034D28313
MKEGFGGRLVVGLVVGALCAAFMAYALPAGREWVSHAAGAAGELLYIALAYVGGAVATVLGGEWVMVGRVLVPKSSSTTEA